MWDHFLSVVLMNLGFIVLLTVPLLLPSVLVVSVSLPRSLIAQVIGGLLVVVYSGAISHGARDIANYERPEFKKTVEYI